MHAKISDSINRTTAVDDAKDELRGLATMLRESVLELAWRQWRALGASAATTTRHQRALQSLIDPEALVLFSLIFLENERRLGDLTRDWVVLNSDLLSVQRIKNLANSYSGSVRQHLDSRLTALAHVAVHEGKDSRWRSLLSIAKNHHVRVESRGSKATREGTKVKTRAVRASLNESSTLLLRLRLGFGVGAKADVLAFLLGTRQDWITIRELVEATAYSAVAVRGAADDLATARMIEVLDPQPARYRADRNQWKDFLGFDPPVWLYWHQQFAFVAAFDAWASDMEGRALSAYAFGAHGRELLRQHERAFAHAQIRLFMRHPQVSDWAANVKDAVQILGADMLRYA